MISVFRIKFKIHTWNHGALVLYLSGLIKQVNPFQIPSITF